MCILISCLCNIAKSDKDTREDIQKVFNLFDDDQTGRISLRNLKRVAKELGETMSGMLCVCVDVSCIMFCRCRITRND